MSHSKIIGYVVKNNNGEYIHNSKDEDSDHNYAARTKPEPIGKADAYRRLAAYIDENAWVADLAPNDANNFYVAPMFYEPTPLDRASEELAGLLQALCNRHGLDLGLTKDQMAKHIAKELDGLKAGGSSFIVTGIPRIDR